MLFKVRHKILDPLQNICSRKKMLNLRYFFFFFKTRVAHPLRIFPGKHQTLNFNQILRNLNLLKIIKFLLNPLSIIFHLRSKISSQRLSPIRNYDKNSNL